MADTGLVVCVFASAPQVDPKMSTDSLMACMSLQPDLLAAQDAAILSCCKVQSNGATTCATTGKTVGPSSDIQGKLHISSAGHLFFFE